MHIFLSLVCSESSQCKDATYSTHWLASRASAEAGCCKVSLLLLLFNLCEE